MAISATADSRFSIRICPACGGGGRQLLFDLKAHQFCSVNPTYDEKFLELLRLEEGDHFPIDRCVDCGFVYARLLPTEDFLTTVYEDVITFRDCREHSENSSSYSRRMHYIATLVELSSLNHLSKALDFGCGLGVTLRLLGAISAQAVGYDPSPVRAETVRMNDAIVVGSLEEIALRGPFDLLICDNVLEHVPEPKRTLQFIASVCKPGSVLFISVPNYETRQVERQLRAAERGGEIDMSLNPWEHLNYFTLQHLDRMLASSGFVPVQSTELPGHVDIGLRPEKNTIGRFKNGLASVLRLVRYMTFGRVARNVEHAYYRYVGVAC